MSALLQHPVSQDWARWAATAAPRTCEKCRREFKPNHPRRRFCGAEDCPDVARAARPDVEPAVARRRRQSGVQGVLADAMIELHRSDGPTGKPEEIGAALRELVTAERAGRPAQIKGALARVQAATIARSLAIQQALTDAGEVRPAT